VIGDAFPPERRGGALGAIGAVFGIAFILGPFLGGVLLPIGWQWLFLINLPIALFVIIMAFRALPGTRRDSRHPLDWPGMTTLAAHLVLLANGINRIDTSRLAASLASTDVWPFLFAAAVLGVAYIVIEKHADDPILRLRLYTSRQTVIAGALATGAGLGQLGVVYLPAMAIAAFGVSHATASFLQLPLVVAVSIASPVIGRLLDRHGSRVVVIGGAVCLVVGMAMLGLFVSAVPEFIVAGVFTGFGLSALVGAPVRYIMLNESPPADRAAAQGLVSLNISIGQLVSSALIAAIVASSGGGTTGYRSAFLFVASMAAVLAVIAVGLKDRAEELSGIIGGRGEERRAG
jgi:MFS family permease